MELFMAIWRDHINGPRWANLPTAIKNACWELGLNVKIEIDKGWIRETVRFSIEGSKDELEALREAFARGVSEYNERL